MENRGAWRGTVVSGPMKGDEVEVRVSGSPIPIYVLAYRCRRNPRRCSLSFAVGDEALRAHFEEHRMRVAWRSSSAPPDAAETPYTVVARPRRAVWVPVPRASHLRRRAAGRRELEETRHPRSSR